ncbi:MAG: toxin-antitoxin system YwqK family antitoxin [Crocinitomicaceae bacterium]
MKLLYIAIVSLLFLCQSCESEIKDELESTCDCKELQYDHAYNVLHLGNRLKPYSGKCLEYYYDGKIKKDFILKEGKYHGTLLFYHQNGQLQSNSEYQEGLLFGHKKVYDDSGNLLFHGIYKRTKLKEVIFDINANQQTN